MQEKGRCLASQEIKALLGFQVLKGDIDEGNIQPSSFEPTIGNECYIVDAEQGFFHPRKDQTVYRSVLELPQRQRVKVDITDGFEVKTGSTYLFPLEERLRGGPFDFVKSSPKSSIGRVFPSTRLMTDYNDAFDEINNFGEGSDLMPWLLFQPLAFNLVVGPGLSFNQLRFFSGLDAMLTPTEVVAEWERNPLLFSKGASGKIDLPTNPRITENLQLHLDLEGSGTEGISVLRARRNPEAIDLRKKDSHVAERYFEPMPARNGSITIKPHEHYLLASNEVLSIPAHLNAELKSYSHMGVIGPLHRAGFVDNGFVGDLVFEVTSEEPTDVHLNHGMPIGELAIYRTNVPEKLYGVDIGSHYNKQSGPKVSKYFSDFDFSTAAKNHTRLNRKVMCQERGLLLGFHDGDTFKPSNEVASLDKLLGVVDSGFFHSRYDCETDPFVLQPIPYILLFDNQGRVFSYVRSDGRKSKGDERLYGRHSLGIGGHVRMEDGPDYMRNTVNRELTRDVQINAGHTTKPTFLGTLYTSEREVDRHHFGLVFGVYTTGLVKSRDSAIENYQMIDAGAVSKLPEWESKYETWSRVLVPHLPNFLTKTRPS